MIEKNNNWPQFRVGCGYDVHKLAADRKLILCGVEIPYESGLLGHSDADVALHALMDALLGAAGLGETATGCRSCWMPKTPPPAAPTGTAGIPAVL